MTITLKIPDDVDIQEYIDAIRQTVMATSGVEPRIINQKTPKTSNPGNGFKTFHQRRNKNG